jgi:hypothetical protein
MDSGSGVFDADLDSPQPLRPVRLQAESVEPFQRLVVNPFLAVLALILVVTFERWAIEHKNLGSFEVAFGLIGLCFFLIQYHCRDCGATGFLLRFRKHVCPTVLARWNQRERPRFRGPGVRAQLLGWFILLASVSILVLITQLVP